MNVLIVDDTPEIRDMLGVILESAGYQDLLFAESAAEAFERLGISGSGALPVDVDAVLMDVMMPDLDGVEACRRIKAVERFRDTPIIMVTAMSEAGFLEAAFAAGAVDYLTKPVNRLELLARVRSAVRLKREMDRRKAREQELEQALREVKVLQGMLPICSHCKKIRNDQDQWQTVESYIKDHAAVDFSHGICPECLDKHYPDK
jgi:sigma-B regulation protein RsbU (phosphoserine phosphatase)